MTRVLITGAGGMLGRKLTQRIQSDGEILGQPLKALCLHDALSFFAANGQSFTTRKIVSNLADNKTIESLVEFAPDVIFHLAAVVSGEAEQNMDLGYDVNMHATTRLLEAIRKSGCAPKFVFASSVAVYGAPLPDPIPDDFHLTPRTSYGAQKAIAELLISDYSRRGFIDGYSLRLPTICVRPGQPNAAASGFFSNIIREPLVGEKAVLPVSDEVLHWHASPRSAIGFFLHAISLDAKEVGAHRSITMPGVAATVGEQIQALREIAGDERVALIERRPDSFVSDIVAGWPRSFSAQRAKELGFLVESSFSEIIQVHIKDELGGEIPQSWADTPYHKPTVMP